MRDADQRKERKWDENDSKIDGEKKQESLKRPQRGEGDIDDHRSTRTNLSREKIQFSIRVFKDFKPSERNGRSVARATTTKSAAGA